jgi:hypothetical protein
MTRRPRTAGALAVAALATAGVSLAGCGDETASAPPPAAEAVPTASAPTSAAQPPRPARDILRGTATLIDGTTVDLARYSGRVALVVNTASQCRFTDQLGGSRGSTSGGGPQG